MRGQYSICGCGRCEKEGLEQELARVARCTEQFIELVYGEGNFTVADEKNAELYAMREAAGRPLVSLFYEPNTEGFWGRFPPTTTGWDAAYGSP